MANFGPLCGKNFIPGDSLENLESPGDLFQPLYNGHLATMATFFCSQGVHCGAVQLTVKSTLEPRSDAEIFMT